LIPLFLLHALFRPSRSGLEALPSPQTFLFLPVFGFNFLSSPPRCHSFVYLGHWRSGDPYGKFLSPTADPNPFYMTFRDWTSKGEVIVTPVFRFCSNFFPTLKNTPVRLYLTIHYYAEAALVIPDARFFVYCSPPPIAIGAQVPLSICRDHFHVPPFFSPAIFASKRLFPF